MPWTTPPPGLDQGVVVGPFESTLTNASHEPGGGDARSEVSAHKQARSMEMGKETAAQEVGKRCWLFPWICCGLWVGAAVVATAT